MQRNSIIEQRQTALAALILSSFYNSLSTRELSLFIYLTIIILFLLSQPKIRKSFVPLFKQLLFSKITFVLMMMIAYIMLIIYLLYLIGFWDFGLLKDSIFWFFGFAFITFFGINKVTAIGDFKKIIVDAVKLALVLEFIINFYTFSLTIELIILPILFITLLLHSLSKDKEGHNEVNTLLSYVLSTIGILLFLYVGYKTFKEHTKLFTVKNLKSFIFPPIASILIIPFFYILTLYMVYETLFVKIRFMSNDDSLKKRLRKAVISNAHINLDKVSLIQKHLKKQYLYEYENYDILIRDIIHRKIL